MGRHYTAPITPAMSPRQPNAPSPVVFPDDFVADILSLLSVKSLTRLRCVIKSWNTLISDPIFVKMHLKRSAQNPHLILRCFSRPPTDHCSFVPFSVRRLLENRSTTTVADDPCYRWNRKDCNWRVVGSCNGLLCLLGIWYQDYRLCFWNPATRVRSDYLGSGTFSTDPHVCFGKFAFGYDNSTDTYMVVSYCVYCYKDDGKDSWRSVVRVFSLRDNIWRNIQSFPVIPLQCNCQGKNEGVYSSGTINWLALHNFKFNYDCKGITIEQFVIVSLDLSTETYTELLLPKGFNEVPCVEPTIGVLMDCLCFYHDFKGTDFVIWQMKEFGVQESWIQLLKFSYLQNLQMKNDLEYHFQWLSPLCLPENSDTLILINEAEYVDPAISYNWRDNKVERIGITNQMWWWFAAKDYIESLVSIC